MRPMGNGGTPQRVNKERVYLLAVAVYSLIPLVQLDKTFVYFVYFLSN